MFCSILTFGVSFQKMFLSVAHLFVVFCCLQFADCCGCFMIAGFWCFVESYLGVVLGCIVHSSVGC